MEIDILIEPDVVDEEKWYRLQSHHKWYAVKACCRRCATRKLQGWTYQVHDFVAISELGSVKTNEVPEWLVRLETRD